MIVPVRASAVFAATEYETEPLPVPFAPAVIVIHVAFDVAVHEQPDAAVTATDAEPAAPGTVADDAPIANVHAGVGGVGGGAGAGGAGAGGAGVGGSGAGGAGAGGCGTGGTGTGGGGAGTAAWAMVTAWPAIITVPLRSVAALAATRSVTDAEAVPVAAPSIVIHDAWLAAVHAHPVSVSTATAIDAPDAGADAAVGETRKRHGAASWTMATCASLTSMVPRRCTGSAFGATR